MLGLGQRGVATARRQEEHTHTHIHTYMTRQTTGQLTQLSVSLPPSHIHKDTIDKGPAHACSPHLVVIAELLPLARARALPRAQLHLLHLVAQSCHRRRQKRLRKARQRRRNKKKSVDHRGAWFAHNTHIAPTMAFLETSLSCAVTSAALMLTPRPPPPPPPPGR